MARIARKEVTQQEIIFCQEYVNGALVPDAYKKAGYKFSTRQAASVNGGQLLKKPLVAAYIKELQERNDSKLDVTIQWKANVLKEVIKKGLEEWIDAKGNSRPNDLAAVIRAVAEFNKMQGHYAPEKMEVDVNSQIRKEVEIAITMIPQYERGY